MGAYNIIAMMSVLFTPCVALYFYYERKGRVLEATPRLLIQYAILACINTPIASAVVGVVKMIFGTPIHFYSGAYVVISMITAMLMVYVQEIFTKAFQIKVEIKGKNDEK